MILIGRRRRQSRTEVDSRMQRHQNRTLCQPLPTCVCVPPDVSSVGFLPYGCSPPFETWCQKSCQLDVVVKILLIYLVVLHPGYTISGDGSPFSICTHPQLWVNLILGYHLTFEYMSHEQVVVHRLRNDLRDGGRVKLEECIMFRLAGLRSRRSAKRANSKTKVPTFLFRDTRRRNTSPNCEKYARS